MERINEQIDNAIQFKWVTMLHMSFYENKKSSTLQRDEKYKVQRENHGKKWHYFIDGDNKEYDDEYQLKVALLTGNSLIQ